MRDYEFALNRQFKALADAKVDINPRKVSKGDLIWLRDEYFSTVKPRTRWNMISMLICFCRWAGNAELSKVKMNYGDTSRQNVRWLNENEVAELMRHVETPTERFFIHCELSLGMRRCEVQRLRTDSFHFGRDSYISVHGKGRNGGKFRKVPMRRDNKGIVEE